MLKIIPCAPWNFPVFRFLTGKGRGVFHGFNGVFNISTVDNRYTRWITCGEYTECERYVNRKSGLSLQTGRAPQASQARPVLRTRTPLSLRDISPRSGESPRNARSLFCGLRPRKASPHRGGGRAQRWPEGLCRAFPQPLSCLLRRGLACPTPTVLLLRTAPP